MSTSAQQSLEPDACPTGCGATIAGTKIMCSRCWGLVPKVDQGAVTSAWSQLSRSFSLSAQRRYADARAAAIEAAQRQTRVKSRRALR